MTKSILDDIIESHERLADSYYRAATEECSEGNAHNVWWLMQQHMSQLTQLRNFQRRFNSMR